MNQELNDFHSLISKGLELQQIDNTNKIPKKCVINIESNILFCGKMKNSSTAEAYNITEFKEAIPKDDDEIIMNFGDKNLILVVSSNRVRNYLVSMFNRLFNNQ